MPKTVCDSHFRDKGFSIAEEIKIWPDDMDLGQDEGVYVMVYQKKESNAQTPTPLHYTPS